MNSKSGISIECFSLLWLCEYGSCRAVITSMILSFLSLSCFIALYLRNILTSSKLSIQICSPSAPYDSWNSIRLKIDPFLAALPSLCEANSSVQFKLLFLVSPDIGTYSSICIQKLIEISHLLMTLSCIFLFMLCRVMLSRSVMSSSLWPHGL